MPQAQEGSKVKVNIAFVLSNGYEIPASKPGEPLELVVGEPSGFAPVDLALVGMRAGESKSVHLSAEEAFGLPDENMIFQVEKAQVAGVDDLKIGTPLEVSNADQQKLVAVVREITDTHVTLDANHPLAGEELDCKIEVVDVA